MRTHVPLHAPDLGLPRRNRSRLRAILWEQGHTGGNRRFPPTLQTPCATKVPRTRRAEPSPPRVGGRCVHALAVATGTVSPATPRGSQCPGQEQGSRRQGLAADSRDDAMGGGIPAHFPEQPAAVQGLRCAVWAPGVLGGRRTSARFPGSVVASEAFSKPVGCTGQWSTTPTGLAGERTADPKRVPSRCRAWLRLCPGLLSR